MSRGARAAGRLLKEAQAALTEAKSPAAEAVQALKLAHSNNPRSGIRDVLRDKRGGER